MLAGADVEALHDPLQFGFRLLAAGERLIEEFVTEEWEFDVAVLVFEVDALRECRWSVAASAPQESRQVVTHFAEQDGQFIGVDARVGFENRYLGH